MRIVHVITKADVGGAQSHVLELSAAQVAAGHDVVVLAGVLGAAATQMTQRGVIVRQEPSLVRSISPLQDLRAARQITASLRTLRPDVVHAHSSKAGVLARLGARRLRVPCVYTAHGWPFQPAAPLQQRIVSRVGETFAARWWGHVICLTKAEADLAVRYRVVSRDRVHVVALGIPDSAFPVAAPQQADSADNRIDPPAIVRIVMVARFAAPKDQRGVISALTQLAPTGWQMDFVGDGDDLEPCQQLIRTLNLADRVSTLGQRDDVERLLSQADIAVLWSRYEGLPLAMMEAMRAGLACVSSLLPGTIELFGQPPVGRLATTGDQLAQALQALIDDQGLRFALGAAARLRYEQSFTLDRMVQCTQQVYEVAIRQP